jgi:hypothetical protein
MEPRVGTGAGKAGYEFEGRMRSGAVKDNRIGDVLYAKLRERP